MSWQLCCRSAQRLWCAEMEGMLVRVVVQWCRLRPWLWRWPKQAAPSGWTGRKPAGYNLCANKDSEGAQPRLVTSSRVQKMGRVGRRHEAGKLGQKAACQARAVPQSHKVRAVPGIVVP
eukprot:1161671-Pelagomonas_calceolata.AAC.14